MAWGKNEHQTTWQHPKVEDKLPRADCRLEVKEIQALWDMSFRRQEESRLKNVHLKETTESIEFMQTWKPAFHVDILYYYIIHVKSSRFVSKRSQWFQIHNKFRILGFSWMWKQCHLSKTKTSCRKAAKPLIMGSCKLPSLLHIMASMSSKKQDFF